MGILYVGQKEYQKALDQYDEVFHLATISKDNVLLQRVHTNKGIVYMRQGKFKDAIQMHQKALQLAQELKDTKDEAFVYNDLGATYLESGNNLDQSIYYLQRSINLRTQNNELSEIAYTYNYLGKAYSQQNKDRPALHWMTKALHTAQDIGNNKQKSEALFEIAQQYQKMNIWDSAFHFLNLYNQCLEEIKTIEKSDEIAALTVEFETKQKEQQIALLFQQNKIQDLDIKQRNLWLVVIGIVALTTLALSFLIYRNKKTKEAKLKKEAEMQQELLHLEALHTLQQEGLRISKDLHDNIGTQLTFLKMTIEDLKKEHSNSIYEDAKYLLEDTIVELRRSVWLINSPNVTVQAWIIKLQEYFKKAKPVGVRWDTKEDNRIIKSRTSYPTLSYCSRSYQQQPETRYGKQYRYRNQKH